MTDYIKALTDWIREAGRGKVLRAEASNETMHLDLETGEWVSDSFTSESFEIDLRKDRQIT